MGDDATLLGQSYPRKSVRIYLHPESFALMENNSVIFAIEKGKIR